MEQIQNIFSYRDMPIRTAIVDSQVWFVAKDVCNVLEITNTSQALIRLDEDERGLISNDTPSGKQQMAHINEAGLYSLVLGSKKPSAREFKRWVTHEVLPSIRKHGAYLTDNVLENALSNPDFMIGLLENLKEEKRLRLELEHQATIDRPKVTYYDTILSTTNAVNISQIANDYGLSGRALNKILKEEKVQRYVGGQWILYQGYKSKGLTKSETITYGVNGATLRTKWTQKGRLFIHELLEKRGINPVIDFK